MNFCQCQKYPVVDVHNCVETFDKKVFLGKIDDTTLQGLLNYGFCEKPIDKNSFNQEDYGWGYNQIHGIPSPEELESLQFIFDCFCDKTNLDMVKQFFQNSMLHCPQEEFINCIDPNVLSCLYSSETLNCGINETLHCVNNQTINC